MYVSKKDRETIKMKFGGKCAYSGTELKEDWQIGLKVQKMNIAQNIIEAHKLKELSCVGFQPMWDELSELLS